MSRPLKYSQKVKNGMLNISIQAPEQDYPSIIMDYCKQTIIGNVIQNDIIHRVQFLDYDKDRLIQENDGNRTYIIRFTYQAFCMPIPERKSLVVMKGKNDKDQLEQFYYNGPLKGLCMSQQLNDNQIRETNVYEVQDVKYFNKGKCLVEIANVRDSSKVISQIKENNQIFNYFREE